MNSIVSSAQDAVTGDRLEDYDGLRLLISDVRVVGKLLNEARYQTLDRLFGVSREDSFLVTVVVVGTVAAMGQRAALKIVRGPPYPELGSMLLGGAGVGRIV